MTTSTITRRDFLVGASDKALQPLKAACIPDTPAPNPSLAEHAAQRLQFGAAPGDVVRIAALGFDAFVDEQLAPASIDDAACQAMIDSKGFVTFGESWAQLYDRRNHATYAEAIRPLSEVSHATWIRMIHSRRQLQERVVNFWHDHFSVQGSQFIVRSMFTKWDETIRAHALGNFRAMLEAVAKHPVMLYYLDNYLNTRNGPNENWAREMFELHTMGDINYRPGINPTVTCDSTVDADGDGIRDFYYDNDVYEAARAFTGWTYEQAGDSPSRGQYKYVDGSHDHFNKFVMCRYFEANLGPEEDAKSVLDILAFHPGTARHLAFKLCRRFVSDNPPDELVIAVADEFRRLKDSPNQIRETLRFLLKRQEFRDARSTKMKRPLEWTVSAMRVLGIPYVISANFSIEWVYNDMGQPLFGWRPPDGPPDVAEYWASSNGMLRRWNFVYTTVSGWWNNQGFNYSTTGIMPDEIRTPAEVADFWAARLIARGISGPTREGLIQFVAEGRDPDTPLAQSEIEEKVAYLAALCTMTPEFMRM